MPVQQTSINEAVGGEFKLVSQGQKIVGIVDIVDKGESQFDEKKRNQYFLTYEIISGPEKGQLLFDYVLNSWWGGDPQPSKLYNICVMSGISHGNPPKDLNELIGKQLSVTVKHKTNKEGQTRAKITDYFPIDKQQLSVEVADDVDQGMKEVEEELGF